MTETGKGAQMYCKKCEKHLFGQPYHTHDGDTYCPGCYDKIFTAETEEPEPRVVPLEAHLVIDPNTGKSWSKRIAPDGGEWYTDGKTNIRADIFEAHLQRKETPQAPIGESEPTERCDDVNIPLYLQKKMLKATFYDTMLWLAEMLDDDDFMQDMEKMADARLEQAHPKWGSTMYAWERQRRLRAIMEELADIFVYASSGEF